ncbi:auxin transporter-like protein 2 [Prunus yedoensis var. nudiflora]|uniref:Auxin transporter-like protein 2 n=1 Tax=Prunus yedoensis var. nudiflora TaxID=2094558 RepID=A0A314YKY3_PRUYE|nr:auxin transporter-like protein 2 [Prunus yedoensis var. nudiflora]
MSARACAREQQQIACGHPHLVPGHHLPILWPHQLHRRITPCQLHSLHHPSSGPHLHVQIRCCKRNAVERPPRFLGGWIGSYTINVFVVVWVFVVGFGFGGWASITNFVHQIDTFGLFTKCYQCPPPTPPMVFNTTSAPAPIHHPHPHRP